MKDKIRAVVDTNIFVSGVISPNGSPGKVLVAAKENKFILVTSNKINEEVLNVLHRSSIYEKYSLTDDIVDGICALLFEGSMITEGKICVSAILSDPKDDMFLAAALEGKADYIISGDSHLLNLGCYQNIEIITAKRFLNILSN